jgi:putative ABC transport system permease protein
MLRNYLLPAWRNLTRNKLYTLINVSGLAVGACSCIVIYIVVAYEYSFDNFHPAGERVYRLGTRIEEHNSYYYSEDVPPPAMAAVRKEIPGLETIAGFYHYQGSVAPNFQPDAILAGPEYFSIFHYDWLAGNPTSSLSHPFSVVLTQSQAKKYLGPLSPDRCLGREIIYDDSLRVRVTGIVKDWGLQTDFPYTDFISFNTIGSSFLRNQYPQDSWHFNPGKPWISTLIKLSEHRQPTLIDTLMTGLVDRHVGTDSFLRLLHFNLVLQPLADIHFNENYIHDGRRKAHLPTLYALMEAALFILLIAVINFINLSTAQSFCRTKEIAIHKLLGCSKPRMISRLLLETGLLVLIAAVIATLLVPPVLAAFRSYIPDGVTFQPLHPSTLLFIGIVILVTTFLAGLYPAMVTAVGTPKISLRKALMVFQFTVSLAFIIGAITMNAQIRFMLTSNPGFNTNAVVTLTNFSHPAGSMRLLKEKAAQITAVQDITLQGHAPIGNAIIELPIQFQGDRTKTQLVSILAGDERFIPFYQLKLVAGRNMEHNDSLREFIINETYCRTLGFNRPADIIGHFLTFQTNTYPIVGVVADFHESSLHDPIYPILIGHIPSLEKSMGIRLTTNTLPHLSALWKEVYPGDPFSYTFLDESIRQFYENDQRIAWLVDFATILAIFISCIGLIGLTLFVVEKKKKDIAIRKVLGASVTDIVLLLNSELVSLIAIALLIASPVAWYKMHQWLQDFAYRITLSCWFFLLAGLSAITIASLTISIQVIRAALASPIKSLKTE